MKPLHLRWLLTFSLKTGVLLPGTITGESPRPGIPIASDPVLDRDSLLARRGPPDLRIPWTLEDGDTGFLYLYEDAPAEGGSVDRAFLLSDRGKVRAGYAEYDSDTDHADEPWYRETIEDVRAFRDRVRGLRDQTNTYLGSLPVLNYFDHTELDHESLVMQLNSSETLPRTTVTLKPGDQSIYVGFEIPFGE